MPRIQGYQQQYQATGQIPARQAQESDFGGPGLQQIGHGMQSLAQDVGYAAKQLQFAESQKQVTDAHLALQKIRTEYTRKAMEEESKANVGDTKFSDRFLLGEDGKGGPGSLKGAYDEGLAQFTDPLAIETYRRGAAHDIETFTVQMSRAQANLAGRYAKQQFNTLTNASQEVVFNNPELYANELQKIHDAIDDQNGIFYRPNIDSGHRETYKGMATEQLSESAVRGLIRRDAPMAKYQLQHGEWGGKLTGEKISTLTDLADTRIHALEIAKKQEEVAARRKLRDGQDEVYAGLYSRWIDAVGTHGQKASQETRDAYATEVSDLLDRGQIRVPQAHTMMTLMKDHADGKTLKSGSSNVFWDFFTRTRYPWSDERKLSDMDEVLEAAARHEITLADVKFLDKVVRDSRTESGQSLAQDRVSYFNSVKNRITKTNRMTGITDGLGDGKFREFTQFALKQEQAAIEAKQDPHGLYNPNSKYYIGQYLDKYVPTLAETTAYMKSEMQRAKQSMDEQKAGQHAATPLSSVTKPVPAPVPPASGKPSRLPGESWEQYKKRNGIK